MALQNSGAISLNQIHVEAGGTSGTQVSLNDTDVRGLVSSTAGTAIDFDDFYGASAYSVTTDVHATVRQLEFANRPSTTTYSAPISRTRRSPDKTKTIVFNYYTKAADVVASSRGKAFCDIFLYNNTSFNMSRRVVNSGGYKATVGGGDSYGSNYDIVALDDTFIVLMEANGIIFAGDTATSNISGTGSILHMICYNYSFQEQWRQAHTITGSSNQKGFLPNNQCESLSNIDVSVSTANTSSDFRRFGFGFLSFQAPIYDGSHIYLAAWYGAAIIKIDPSNGDILAKTAFRYTTTGKSASLPSLATAAQFKMKQSSYDEDQLILSTDSSRWMIINKSNLSVSHQSGHKFFEGGNNNWYSHQAFDIADDPNNGDIYLFHSASVPAGKFSDTFLRIIKQARNATYGTIASYSPRRKRATFCSNPSFIGVDSTYIYYWSHFAAVAAYGNGVSRMTKSSMSLPTSHHNIMTHRNVADNGYTSSSQTNNISDRQQDAQVAVYFDGTTDSYEFSYHDYRFGTNVEVQMGTGLIATDDMNSAFFSSSATTGYNGYKMVANSSVAADSGTQNYQTDTSAPSSTTGKTDDIGGWTTITINVSSSSTSGYWGLHNDTLPVRMGGNSNTNPPALEFGSN